MSKRFPRVPTNNLFVARSRQEDEIRRKGLPLRSPVGRASFRYPSSCGDLTRPRNKSVLRRECVLFPRSSLPLPPFRFSDTFLADGAQKQLLLE